ncbi:site-2 protease family protein [Actinobaculum sp. 352]|uniref:M50 family metallopeptidase n=2 Tax=unclassified Actinobaculum TaxID=2609299 RepID=UPI000F7E8259|nr:site-2 protease family protein [Actinobaculum sp. 352]RTE49465.1 RIP metalloprotease [Actinobaculum sp. 352]
MRSIPGILFLVLGLLVSVGLHELGHLVPAKKFGVKVSQYFIGFGPTLWSTTIRGTEYGLKAIPLGGYVRLSGMLAPGKESRKRVGRRGQVTLAEEARLASAEEIGPGEEDQAFWRLSAPRKLVVMFSGPFVNLLLAGLCFTIVMCGIGSPTPTNQVSYVAQCITTAQECTSDDPVSPARAAGLESGDTITRWGDADIENWEDVQSAIAAGGDAPVSVTVTRAGEERTLTVTPVLTQRPVTDSSGNVVTDSSGNLVTELRPYVGVSPAYAQVAQPLSAVPGQVWTISKATAGVLLRLPVELWHTTTDLISGNERSTSGVVGIVGVAGMAGEITSADSDLYGVSARIGDLLLLLGSLNLTLFIFNLIPLLPLDGGHMAGALYEGIRRQIARWRGRPDPGPVDTARLMPLSYAVAVAFIAMTVLLIVADIVNPISLR